MHFHPVWASLAALLFVIEVLIALFVRDSFVRPYFGDVLVVMLIFFTLLALWPGPPVRLAMGVLLFAFVVEATQALGLIHRLGLSDNTLAKLVMGNTFQWGDLLCYLVGSLASLWIVRATGYRRING